MLLHESQTPVGTPFRVTCDSSDPASDSPISFVGQDPTSQGEFDQVLATPFQACEAAIAILGHYRPEALALSA